MYDGQAKMDKKLPKVDIKNCLKRSSATEDLFFGKLYGKLSNLMVSYEMGNLNQTVDLIYEIDELALKVLADSDC